MPHIGIHLTGADLAHYAKDGGYEYEGLFYQDAEDFLNIALLHGCGCGNPDENILYVLKGLELLEPKCSSNDRKAILAFYDARRTKEVTHFGSRAAAQFFHYWATREGYLEHGTSIPGWLTEKGHTLVALLRDWREHYYVPDGE